MVSLLRDEGDELVDSVSSDDHAGIRWPWTTSRLGATGESALSTAEQPYELQVPDVYLSRATITTSSPGSATCSCHPPARTRR